LIGLDDPVKSLIISVLLVLKCIYKLVVLVWENVGTRNELKLLLSELNLHINDVLRKLIFSRYLRYPWKMINFLELINAIIHVILNVPIGPKYIPTLPLRTLKPWLVYRCIIM